jgi:phosphohistidine phosphatase SixA
MILDFRHPVRGMVRRQALPVLLACFILAFSFPCRSFAKTADKGVTTVFLVRHAEKDSIPAGDPHLSMQGRERAEALAHMLGKAGVTSIVTTELQRTRETATPLANLLGIPLTVIPVIWNQTTPRTVSPQFYTALLRHIQANGGGTILVVGHSNTIPELIRVLGGPSGITIREDAYDHIFTMVLRKGTPIKLLDLRYGAE